MAVAFLFILFFNQKPRVCRQNKNHAYRLGTHYIPIPSTFIVFISTLFSTYQRTVRPLDTCTWDRKKNVAHNWLCTSYSMKVKMKIKAVYLQGFWPKTVYLKCFGIQLKTVYLRGPCSLRPCISRPCCNTQKKSLPARLLGRWE